MLVQDLMTPDPTTITADATIKEALALLDDLGVTSLPVVDARRRLCGIVSEADLIRDVVARDPRAQASAVVVESLYPPHRVEDVYTRSAVSARPAEDVADAVEAMTAISAKSLPVVDDDGRLVGIISRSDVVAALARSDDVIAADIDAVLSDLGRQDWLVEVEDGVVHLSGPDGPAERSLAFVVARVVPGVVEVRVD